jgi:hypothetical protein
MIRTWNSLNFPLCPRLNFPALPSPELSAAIGKQRRPMVRPMPVTGRRKATVTRFYDYDEVPDSCDADDGSGKAERNAKEQKSTAEKTTAFHRSDEAEQTSKEQRFTTKTTSAKGRAGASNLTDSQWTVIVSTEQTQLACLSVNSIPGVKHSTRAWSMPRKKPAKRSMSWLHSHHSLASKFFKR